MKWPFCPRKAHYRPISGISISNNYRDFKYFAWPDSIQPPHKRIRSRSRFIVEEMNKRNIKLEDEEITKLHNKAYGHPEEIARDRELAEEMLATSAAHKKKYPNSPRLSDHYRDRPREQK